MLEMVDTRSITSELLYLQKPGRVRTSRSSWHISWQNHEREAVHSHRHEVIHASVECVALGLDPLDACLVVADSSRSDSTICLDVSPAMKSCGIKGRPRLFKVKREICGINRTRGRQGRSFLKSELDTRPELAMDFVTAPPRMATYIECSAQIYSIYTRYIAPEDIHPYSIDEVFMDVTPYLTTYGMSAHELAMTMIREVLAETGITATAGIGTNLYLCKVAMDIVAKKMPPDKDGVRIAELDEMSYRQLLWNHTPLTDFWRVGPGVYEKLAIYGIRTMGDIARCSIRNEGLLYKLFGVNAELLIDHAWGWEPVTMENIKNYRPESHSLSHSQEAILRIKKQFGKNAILKGTSYEEGATQRERNRQIAGHHECDDIIRLPHHVSPTRQRMPLEKRAAQFAPFAAISGYDDAIEAVLQHVDKKMELSKDREEELEWQLASALESGDAVRITYFQARESGGGIYTSATGRIREINGQRKELVMSDGLSIALDNIIGID